MGVRLILNIFYRVFETFFGFNINLVLMLFKYNLIEYLGRMAELVDAHDSKSCFARSESFKSSTSLYKGGFFNPTLKIILENYDGIMNIILPTLGKERQQTYCPFLPICPDTGYVLEIPVIEIDKINSKIIFDNK